MKFGRRDRRSFLALTLTFSLILGTIFMPEVFAEETISETGEETLATQESTEIEETAAFAENASDGVEPIVVAENTSDTGTPANGAEEPLEASETAGSTETITENGASGNVAENGETANTTENASENGETAGTTENISEDGETTENTSENGENANTTENASESGGSTETTENTSENGENTDSTETISESGENIDTTENSSENDKSFQEEIDNGNQDAVIVPDEDAEDETSAANDSEEDAETQTGEETKPLYTMNVVFDGKTLEKNPGIDDASKNTGFEWLSGEVKSMTLTLTKNESVTADASKSYVVCLKVPETLYFSGLPEATAINGVEEVAFIKNTCPKVYNSVGDYIDLPGFSQYSGEMLLRLNPSVDVITIPNIGIIYNKDLIGHTGGSQDLANPVEASFVSLETGKALNAVTTEDKTVLESYIVGSISIKTGSLRGSNMRNYMSSDGFQAMSITEQDIQIGRLDKISYAGGTAGQAEQYYKTLTVVFSCPYVVVNGKNYYLDFDDSDKALTTNTQGTKKCFKISKNVEYDKTMHTLTYSFKDIYLGGHTAFFYSPQFYWPEALKDQTIEETIPVQGAGWEIKEQTCYTEAAGSLVNNYEPKNKASFYPNGVNVTLTSSAEAPEGDKIAKRRIYQGVTRENGIEGALGFFDIHNKGTEDSPEVKISFDFNTGAGGGAQYYITQVNLPVYGNTAGVDVAYTLASDGNNDITGTLHYGNSSSFSCYVKNLRETSKVDATYYIKSLSYTTQLQRGTGYHMETAHLWRNRVTDSGLYFGYLEGGVDTEAHAIMTITSTDETKAIDLGGQTVLTSTETSTVGTENYLAFKISGMKIANDSSSTAITAGDSTTLKFQVDVSSEEYFGAGNANVKYVNGYHVFENGIFYICLPEGVSIAGTEQVKITRSDQNITANSVQKIGDVFTVDNQKAQWWEIKAKDIRQSGGKNFTVEVQLATDLTMNNLSWSFKNCVAVRAEGQRISWGAAGNGIICNTTQEMPSKTASAEKFIKLSSYLTGVNDTEELGMNIENTSDLKMTVARAEAKLDVTTGIKAGSEDANQSNVRISDADTALTYEVTVASDDGGYAENFEYYIPIVSTESALDPNTLVARKDFGLTLQQAVTIQKAGTVTDDPPFEVYYTKDVNLTGANIRNESVDWKDATQLSNDFSLIRAVKIVTKKSAFIKDGESYVFSLSLKYAGTSEAFSEDAGSVSRWRSFGYYTYIRNGANTTATYPSQPRSVTVCYKKDLRKDPMSLTLDTGAETNVVHGELMLPGIIAGSSQTFKNAQTFVVKKVEVKQIQLIQSNPANLTGTNANTQFRIVFNMNNATGENGTASQLSEQGTDPGRQWKVGQNGTVKLQAEATFSKALTDTVTDRYLDVTVGNDNVDIVFRIQLKRVVQPASATGSGVTEGASYQVPEIKKECTIAQQSAFTALYVVKDFVPGNYKSEEISWGSGDSTAAGFPAKTKIIMMEITGANMVSSFWYYKTVGGESTIDLNSFKRMSGNGNYSYDTIAAASKDLKYMFVVDFSEATLALGTYQFYWKAVPKDGSDASVSELSYPYPVLVTAEKTYQLAVNTTEGLFPEATISYTVGEAGNDSYIAHRSMALVLKPEAGSGLPEDARLVCGDERYWANQDGNYIIPIENIASGSKTLSLTSDMFPDEAKSYSFTAELYLAESTANSSPMNGEQKASQTLTFEKSEKKKPSLSVTGDQIGTIAEWSAGKTIDIQMKNIEGGKVTVKAYSGLSGTQQVTNIVSSVAGMFDIQSGVGTYKKDNNGTGLLKLSGDVQPGSYRLIFEVKDAEDKIVMQVPYYFIVQ